MLELLSESACFDGVQRLYVHQSAAIGLPMKFSVFVPPRRGVAPLPALFCLAGLTCNEETFAIKAGAQRFAAEYGVMLIAPDTSPRGAETDGECNNWDNALGAGFYLDATQEPWCHHYRMESYVAYELYRIAIDELNARPDAIGLCGHSMGGHGALVLALRHVGRFRSVSAFAPITNPMDSPWGEEAFTRFLGPDRANWRAYDATELLLERGPTLPGEVLIDQGLGDKFLDLQLKPGRFERVCDQVGQALKMRLHAGYDHGYYFISTFIGDHIRHHASVLADVQTVP